MRIKRLLCLTIASVLIMGSFAACGSSDDSDTEVELVEPVGVTADYAVVTRRDLATSKVLSGKVVPKTVETHFPTNQQFKSFAKLPGAEVKAGDAIMYASTEAIDKQIEDMEKHISEALEDYSEVIADYNKTLAEAKFDVDYYGQIVQNFEKMTDAEKASYGGMGYDAEYAKYKGKYQNAVARKERCEQDIKEKTELYELDADFDKKTLKRLRAKRNDVIASAPISGRVVAINYFDETSYINKEVSVAAVGDFNNLEVKTEMIYQSEVKKAVDVYAIVNGVRYDTMYKELTVEEKEAAAEQSESFSTFLISDPEKTVKAGDYAAIVLVTDKRDDVLTVPKDAVNTDADGAFVYVFDGEKTNYTPVKTGLISGLYTEIVSGLNEGDKVVSEFKVDRSSKTSTLSRGRITANYKGNGYLYYSKVEWIKNPVEYGTTYIDELKVHRYERVEKGQEIAVIRVKANDVDIRRNERTLQRAKEDLAELEKNNENDRNKRQIKNQNEYIKELEEKLSDMKKDKVRTTVVAPYSGIITDIINFEEGDILQKDGRVAQISSETDCFVVVEDTSGQLSCGNKADIAYTNAENQKVQVVGDVVTVAPCALSKYLTTNYVLIQVSPEDMAAMAETNRGADGWWSRTQFGVSADIRSMDNVILVPRSAVKFEGGVTYVKVLDENGNPDYLSFIAGGSDNNNYWVAEGLTEGMTICLE